MNAGAFTTYQLVQSPNISFLFKFYDLEWII